MNLLGLSALIVASKINDSTPKISDYVQIFRHSLTQLNFNSPFNNDRFVKQTLISLEEELLIANNFFIDIKLPFEVLTQFERVIAFELIDQRCLSPDKED